MFWLDTIFIAKYILNIYKTPWAYKLNTMISTKFVPDYKLNIDHMHYKLPIWFTLLFSLFYLTEFPSIIPYDTKSSSHISIIHKARSQVLYLYAYDNGMFQYEPHKMSGSNHVDMWLLGLLHCGGTVVVYLGLSGYIVVDFVCRCILGWVYWLVLWLLRM